MISQNAVMSWDAADGSWLTASLGEIHCRALSLPSSVADRRRSSVLTAREDRWGYFEAKDADGTAGGGGQRRDGDEGLPRENSSGGLGGMPRMRRASSGGLGPQLASAVLEKIGGEWHEAMWREWELLLDFVSTSSAVLSLQSALALASVPAARHLLSARPIASAAVILAGTALVAAGCLVLERADVGFRPIEGDDDDDDDDDDESDSRNAFPLSSQMGKAPPASPSVVTLACHSETWRLTGLGLIVAGFVASVAPLLAAETASEGRPKLLSVASLLGGSAAVSIIVRTPHSEPWEWWARVSYVGSDGMKMMMTMGREHASEVQSSTTPGAEPVAHGHAQLARQVAAAAQSPSSARGQGDHWGPLESVSEEARAPGKLAVFGAWLRTFAAAVPLRRSWMVGSVTGALFAAVRAGSAGGEEANRLTGVMLIVAALKPVSLLLLHAGDLKNTYRTCSLRVYCPRSAYAAQGGSISMCMWHLQSEVVSEAALQRQLASLQTKAFLLTCFVTLIPPQYSIPFVLSRAFLSEGIVRKVVT